MQILTQLHSLREVVAGFFNGRHDICASARGFDGVASSWVRPCRGSSGVAEHRNHESTAGDNLCLVQTRADISMPTGWLAEFSMMDG